MDIAETDTEEDMAASMAAAKVSMDAGVIYREQRRQ
jgi:hypothetical protein